jgi:hypothetical protein
VHVTGEDREQVEQEPDWQRRARIARIFGDELPATTSDERDPGQPAGDDAGESASERWLKDQVPPHHG